MLKPDDLRQLAEELMQNERDGSGTNAGRISLAHDLEKIANRIEDRAEEAQRALAVLRGNVTSF